MLQLIYGLINGLHIVLLIVFVYWAILLWRDHRRGFNGMTVGILALVLAYNIHNELWSTFTTLAGALEKNDDWRLFIMGWRAIQLATAIIGVFIFGRCYQADGTDNKKTQQQDNESFSAGGPELKAGSEPGQDKP